MAILISNETQVLVQGITGSVGSFQTRIMLDYGTRVVAGVTPGKGGSHLAGVPIYDLVEEVVREHRIDAAISFVPARFAKMAALEAIASCIPLLVITAEGIPDQDILALLYYAAAKGTTIVGPDTPGLIAPGKCKLGVHPHQMFRAGPVGVLSRSGSLSYEVCRLLTAAGIGQSSVVGIGGGPLWGLSQEDVLGMFEADPETKAIVLLGEVGGTMEHHAAEYIKSHMTKPVVGLIVGRSSPQGARMGHAGAIIGGAEETAFGKIAALKAAGVHIALNSQQVPALINVLGVN